MYYTQTPNDIYAVMDDMSNSELRVTMALVRETYGYHRDICTMTYDDFAAYGLTSSESIRRGITEVLARGFFAKGNGRSEFVKAGKPSGNEELGNEETSVNEELKTSVNEGFNGLENFGKRRVPLYKDKTPTVLKNKSGGVPVSPPPRPAWKMPSGLNTPEFENAWISWYRHLADKQRPLTQTSGELQLEALADMGLVRAIASIKHSIKRGWLSIHEPQESTVSNAENGAGQTQREIIGAAVAAAIGGF